MDSSKRIAEMQQSPTRKLVPFAEEARKAGKKIYHLNIGQPDIETPAEFFEAVRNFDKKVLEYSVSQGDPKLIQAISEYYEKYDIHYEKKDILITNGGSEALLFALLVTCNHGDEVLAPEPFYTNFNSYARLAGVNISPITTYAENGFALPSQEEIIKAVKPNTRAFLLSNPGNPTGVVYSEAEVRMIADIAKEKDLFIIADEVYREFVYDGLPYTSFGTMEDVSDRVIIADSISKRYSACGARIGSIASKNKQLMANVLKLCQTRLCVPTLEQVGAAALYKVDNSYFKEVNNEYKKRRDIVFKGLNDMPGVVCKKPEGAFYCNAKFPVENAEDFIIWMLRNFDLDGETVMMTPTESFYATPGKGRDEARIAYVLNEHDLHRSMIILKDGLARYIVENQ